MNAESLSRRWYLCGLTYLVIGISLGVYMGAKGDHSQFPAHAHINLLGWASMCLTGLLYRSFPAAARSALATWHFWLYQCLRAGAADRGVHLLHGSHRSRADHWRRLGGDTHLGAALLVGDFFGAQQPGIVCPQTKHVADSRRSAMKILPVSWL